MEDTEKQIANIMNAIQAGIITPTTKEALQRAEAEHEQAKQQLQANNHATNAIKTVLPNIAERYRAMVCSLGQTLYADVGQARECLKALMGQIRLLPTANGYLEAELRHNREGFVRLALGDAFKARLVAGARFSSNFNTADDPPVLIVQIPAKGQQGDVKIKNLAA